MISKNHNFTSNRFLPHFFWASIIFHLIFFLLVYFFNTNSIHIKNEESYYYYVPAYVPEPSPQRAMANAVTKQTTPQKNLKPDTNEDSELKIDKSIDLSQVKLKYHDALKEADAFARLSQPAENTVPQDKYSTPIRLIGEKLLDDPLRKLLGAAITARLYYPSVAQELHLRGISSIGFILSPQGEITQARLVKSSREKILDEAALNAVASVPRIENVDLYLKEPKYLVVNIIF